jgi:hypothetical protein
MLLKPFEKSAEMVLHKEPHGKPRSVGRKAQDAELRVGIDFCACIFHGIAADDFDDGFFEQAFRFVINFFDGIQRITEKRRINFIGALRPVKNGRIAEQLRIICQKVIYTVV